MQRLGPDLNSEPNLQALPAMGNLPFHNASNLHRLVVNSSFNYFLFQTVLILARKLFFFCGFVLLMLPRSRLVAKTTQLEGEKMQKETEVQKLMEENVRLSALLDKKEAQLLAMNEQCKVMALSASNI